MGRKAIEYHRHDVLLITAANASFRAIVEHPGAEPTQESALVSLILRQGSGFAQVKGKTSHAHCGFFNVEKILALGVAGLQGILAQNIFKMDLDPWSTNGRHRHCPVQYKSSYAKVSSFPRGPMHFNSHSIALGSTL